VRAPAALILLSLSSQISAQDRPQVPVELEQEQDLIFASAKFGNWSAFALRQSAPDYDVNKVSCAIATPDAVFMQTRIQESAQLGTQWIFFWQSMNELQMKFDGISIGNKAYDLTALPWRLNGQPSSDGIVLTYEITMLAFRKNSTFEWLPVSFLVDEMMEAKSFTISFSYEPIGEASQSRIRKAGKRTFDLTGFKGASKWCGRQLLADRLGQEDVDALVK
jgi:hypothetical protein